LTDARLLTAGLIFAAILLLGLAAVLMLRDNSAKDMEARVIAATRGRVAPDPLREAPLIGIRRLLHWLGRTIRGNTRFYSERDILVLEGMISGSGMNPARVLPIILGLKAVMVLAVPAIGFTYARLANFSGSAQFITLFVCIPFGMLGPEWVLTFLRRPYMAALRRGIPDALDLLVVCSEAGMALESALEHVSKEIRHSNPAVSVALAKLLDELLVLPDRREAFKNFGDRTGIEGARRLATMLGQSMQYGTPLSQVLRTIAIDLRRERLLALETKAARLPVLLVLPLILFIMPSMFIVLAGPAMMRLTDTLHAVARGEPLPK
jgi:tight adherence protein C